MYLSMIRIENFRCFGEGPNGFEMRLRPGLTALVGENDHGKTAVIDALRFALGTTDQEWHRLEDDDFYGGQTTREIRIVCKFQGLSAANQRAFVEYLTYCEEESDEPVLYVNWTAKDIGETVRGEPYRRVDVRSGKNGKGPIMDSEPRGFLRTTYLRPLRDADEALSSGRGSRLSQILLHADQIKTSGGVYDPNVEISRDSLEALNVLGLGDLANDLLRKQEGVLNTREKIDEHLHELSLRGDDLKSDINVGGATASEAVRLRQLLEKFDLGLQRRSPLTPIPVTSAHVEVPPIYQDKPERSSGKLGLGSKNLLFIACELLLLSQERAGNKLLLIEEPEVHLHAQRQLRVMASLLSHTDDWPSAKAANAAAAGSTQNAQDHSEGKPSVEAIQIIITTHSPNLASAIKLRNLVMIRDGRAFSMAEGDTELEPSDYRFLERFLDVTKANLFFARGVMIVEGDAENILLPSLAKLIGRDFTEHGVSIVNVGGVGLRRYARIFQRRDLKKDGPLGIRVACVTDLDVMPDCARDITGRSLPTKSELGEAKLNELRGGLSKKTTGQMVETFIADEWTLEYDLAFYGLAEDVYIAACLAKRDEALTKKGEDFDEGKQEAEVITALEAFKILEQEAADMIENVTADGYMSKAVLAAKVYSSFTKGTKASKPIAAQYLARRLHSKHEKEELTAGDLRSQLPTYLVKAIDYVTSSKA